MYEINITDTAAADLRHAAMYIAAKLGNKAAALDLLNESDNTIKSLSEFPYRNALVEDEFLASIGIRIQSVKNYLIFYLIREDTKTISILRYLYSRRNWIDILKTDFSSF